MSEDNDTRPAQPSSADNTKELIVETLRGIFDPEIPVNIYELGLVYGVELDQNGTARIDMTLTSPNCPVAESLPREVEEKVAIIPGVTHAEVNLVWEPTWTPELMTEAAKLELGMF